VAYYFASDVHLRFDCPDRDRRFRDWLVRLNRDDSLVLGGDLCDFWMGARRAENELMRSESLQALAGFRRTGGALSIMPGNHDAWLCPFYESELGAQIIPEPYDVTTYGLRVRLVHGHLLGARRIWKSWMESRWFFEGFGYVPLPFARILDQALSWKNERGLKSDEERHLHVYRAYAALCRGAADLVVVGHVHRAVDDAQTEPRLIVLGGWQRRASYLKIDAAGADFQVEDDRGERPLATSPNIAAAMPAGLLQKDVSPGTPVSPCPSPTAHRAERHES
jgi:UDP-2,3-diacylglucosamine hydrolase